MICYENYLLHWDFECNISGMLLEIPETDEVFCVHCCKVLIVPRIIISQDIYQTWDFRDQYCVGSLIGRFDRFFTERFW